MQLHHAPEGFANKHVSFGLSFAPALAPSLQKPHIDVCNNVHGDGDHSETPAPIERESVRARAREISLSPMAV
jgi:hypothetical protein